MTSPELTTLLVSQCRPTKGEATGVHWAEVSCDIKLITGFAPDSDRVVAAFRAAGFWVRSREDEPRSVCINRADWAKAVQSARTAAYQAREALANAASSMPKAIDELIARTDARNLEMDQRLEAARARSAELLRVYAL